MKTVIIFFFLTFHVFGQKTCDFNGYIFLEKVKVDSNSTIVYYTDDDRDFIAYYKSCQDSLIKFIFKKRLLNIKGLLAITPNRVILGTPRIEKDTLGKVRYYSIEKNKFLDYPTYTYIINKVKLISTSKKTFMLSIKVGSENFDENFEIYYRSKKALKAYKTVAAKIDNSKITCISFSGTDF